MVQKIEVRRRVRINGHRIYIQKRNKEYKMRDCATFQNLVQRFTFQLMH